MEKKINAKIQKKLDNIVNLKAELTGWKKLSEDEVQQSLKGFEKTPRDEVSSFYNDYLNDSSFGNVLLDIANHYNANSKINIFVVSALGNLMERYNLPETNRIYDFFIVNSQKKEVSVYVAMFLTNLKNFVNFPNKWDYVLSIKDMKPTKIGESTFEMIVKDFRADLPMEYKKLVSRHFIQKSETANSDSGREYFLGLANQFEN